MRSSFSSYYESLRGAFATHAHEIFGNSKLHNSQLFKLSLLLY